MLRLIWCVVLVVFFSSFSFGRSKDTIQVDVKAVHQVTHEARDTRAVIDKGILGANSPNRSMEVFDVQAIINSEHVVLVCQDDKGCEAPSVGIHPAEMKRRGYMKMTFDLPVTHREVSRWYKIAGSW